MGLLLTGDKELLKKFDALTGPEQKKAIRKGTREGAKIIQAETKAQVPVKSGNLRKAIKVKAMPRSRVTFGTRATISFKGGGKFYGSFQEWGTKHIEAKGFMKKSANNKGEQALNRTADILKDEIIKIATK